VLLARPAEEEEEEEEEEVDDDDDCGADDTVNDGAIGDDRGDVPVLLLPIVLPLIVGIRDSN